MGLKKQRKKLPGRRRKRARYSFAPVFILFGLLAASGLAVWLSPAKPQTTPRDTALLHVAPQPAKPAPQRGYGFSAEPESYHAGSVSAAPQLLTPPRPRIAIVIDDIGPDYRQSLQALELHPKITMAILPYASKAATLAQQAQVKGHDIILHMPMEPDDLETNNPGPQALLSSLPPAEMQQRLVRALDTGAGYIGLNNHMGSRLTQDPVAMRVVMDALRARNLFFLDSVTSPRSVGAKVATQAGVAYARRDVFIDHVDEPQEIRQQLRRAEVVALAHGRAIIIGHPYRNTLSALQQWLPQLEKNGFEIVRLKELVAEPAGSRPSASR